MPSLLRGFSAPVNGCGPSLSDEDLLVLMTHDSDPFNRWEAGQTVLTRVMLRSGPLQSAEDRVRRRDARRWPPSVLDLARAGSRLRGAGADSSRAKSTWRDEIGADVDPDVIFAARRERCGPRSAEPCWRRNWRT